MKQIKLINLKLTNFKGIESFEFIPGGKNARIFGDNATGKTTVYDAFLWLLFDKDSMNSAKFEIKPLDKDGEPAHGIEHIAEAVIDCNGGKIDLKKVFAEKYTKSRGKATKEFTGHETIYFIDGVPVKKGEYGQLIKDLVDEGIFCLLTNSRYFNEALKWERRREIVLQICGDVAVDDVLATDESLVSLAKILDTKSVDDYKKSINAKRKKINEEIERIPIRIDEATKSMPSKPAESLNDLKAKKALLEADKAKKHKQLAAIGKPEGQVEVERQIFELEKKIEAEKIEFLSKKSKSISNIKSKISAAESEKKTVTATHAAEKQRLADLLATKSADEKHLEGYRKAWIETNATQPPKFEADDICPTCKQPLPYEQIEAASQKVIKDFNRNKSKLLEGYAKSGVDTKAQINKTNAEIEAANNKIAELQTVIDSTSKTISGLSDELKTIESQEIMPGPEITKKIETLKKSIIPDADQTHEKAELETLINHITDEINECSTGITAQESSVKILARIEDLKAQEKTLAAEYEALEEQLLLCEKFTRARVGLLEDKVAGKFKMARFKMFVNQINEGLRDCCETMYDGVPYGNLNNAARINVGLDIINTLTEHYGVSAPIFIDNAESITKINPVSAQTIELIVSEDHKKLTTGE